MSSEAAIIVAIFIITTSLVLLMSRVARGRLQAKEDELKKAAALRGWTFGKKTERGYRIYTFSGTTEGIPWEAESAVLVAGSNRRQRRRHVARWHGKWSPGVAAPIAAMGVPKGKEVMTHKIAQSDGFLAQMAQKAAGYAFDMALDVYFGKEIGGQIDATTFKHIDQPAVPGYIFMAADPDEAKRVLSEGLQRALLDATSDKGSVLSEDDRPYLLLRPQSLSLARMEQIRKIDELEQFVKAGVGLTRAFRFGRPTS
ncbi:MAG TPA: hypothetical protein VFV51_15620 [Vicinamibacterales bacterium]|nr:hypothetical protein [Vicinamibacterales bacterium]